MRRCSHRNWISGRRCLLFDYYATIHAESRYYASFDDAALYAYVFAYYAEAYAGWDLGF